MLEAQDTFISSPIFKVKKPPSCTVENKEQEENILHKGIASRTFTKTFDLAENIEVTEASFKNGMVIIKLKRNIPEDKMPRLIEFT